MYWKVAIFIWPFLKEMLLGETTVKEAVQNNKIRVLAIGVIFLSLALNFFTVPRLVTITNEHLGMVRSAAALEKELKELRELKAKTSCRAPVAPAMVPEPERKTIVNPYVIPRTPQKATRPQNEELTDDERLREIRERFLRLKKAEEASP